MGRDEDAEDSEVAELTVPPAEIKVEAEPSPEPAISVDTSVDDDVNQCHSLLLASRGHTVLTVRSRRVHI
jgi:hypothetical protein